MFYESKTGVIMWILGHLCKALFLYMYVLKFINGE